MQRRKTHRLFVLKKHLEKNRRFLEDFLTISKNKEKNYLKKAKYSQIIVLRDLLRNIAEKKFPISNNLQELCIKNKIKARFGIKNKRDINLESAKSLIIRTKNILKPLISYIFEKPENGN